MTEVETAWFSGLFDGEGYIPITNRKSKTPSFGMGITMTSLDALVRVKEIAGCGNIRGIKYNSPLNRSDTWNWNVCGSNALFLLEQMIPYLIVKKKRAEKAVAREVFPLGFDLSPARAAQMRRLHGKAS
jgi:hypothetical protein